MNHLEALKEFLFVPRKIVLTGHRNPDGDAIGACLSLKYVLEKCGHHITVVLPSDYPKLFDWLHQIDQIFIYDYQDDQANPFIDAADLAFYLDYNALDRIDKLGARITNVKDITGVMIDHHRYPEDLGDYQFHDEHASSTCELVYDFLVKMDFGMHMDQFVAEALMVGILTDTGNFSYNIRPELFNKVAEILKQPLDYADLQYRLYYALEEKQIRLLGHALANRMEMMPEYKTGLIYLNRDDYKHFNILRGDTEGIVNYILKMQDVVFAVFITEQPGIVKLSFRSKRSFNVQAFASKHFSGGGHINASGGSSKLTLEGTIKYLKALLPEYQNELIHA